MFRPDHYVVGDLVYYCYSGDSLIAKRKIGIVQAVRLKSHFPRYVVYWFSDKISSEHVANNLDLVYNKKVD